MCNWLILIAGIQICNWLIFTYIINSNIFRNNRLILQLWRAQNNWFCSILDNLMLINCLIIVRPQIIPWKPHRPITCLSCPLGSNLLMDLKALFHESIMKLEVQQLVNSLGPRLCHGVSGSHVLFVFSLV